MQCKGHLSHIPTCQIPPLIKRNRLALNIITGLLQK